MEKYRRCIDPALRAEDFTGAYAIYGIDLASKLDISAILRLHWKPDAAGVIHYYFLADFYLPSETVINEGNPEYEGWAADGYLHTTDGAVTNLAELQEHIRDEARDYVTLSLAYDPMQATQMSQGLLEEGLEMVELPQTLKNMSEPMKFLQALIYEERIHFEDNPVLHWMFGNVVCHVDAKENIYPRKEKKADKIDGVVAAIMALQQAIQLNVEQEYPTGRQDDTGEGIDWSSFTLN